MAQGPGGSGAGTAHPGHCPLRGCEGPGGELPVFPFLLLFPGFSGAAFSQRGTGSCSLAALGSCVWSASSALLERGFVLLQPL